MARLGVGQGSGDIVEIRRQCRRFALFQLFVLAAAVATGLGGFVLVAASGAVLGAVLALWAGLACAGPLIEAAAEYDMIPVALSPIRKADYERLWAQAVRDPSLRGKVERILAERNAITRYEYEHLMEGEDPEIMCLP